MNQNIALIESFKPSTDDILDILTYPNPILLKISEPVTIFDNSLENLCIQMLNTMYKAPGIGLAAPQIGLNKRLIVLDIDYSFEEKTLADSSIIKTPKNLNPRIFINPVIKEKFGKIKYQEGCLSLPKIFEDVERDEKIILAYQDIKGNEHQLEAEGLLAVCIQHEIDHLNGIVFIDHLSMLKKSLCKKKLAKQKKK